MGAGFNSTCSKRQTKLNLNLPSATALIEQMQSYFSEIEDPRVQRTRSHLLTDILIIGILSVIAGGKGWEDMENYGLSKFDWLREFLALPSGIPCADTFRRVFELINPQVFERCFQRWVQSIVKTIGAPVIPIDAKTQARFLRERAAEISVAFG